MHVKLNISTNQTNIVEREMEEHLNHNHDDDDLTEEERSGVGGSRWNPTKEQIELLERVYSTEGVRTPSADQIRQITARLRVYGHVEGKNVFYWFQNHKARQRQKQRHDRCLLASANSSTNHSHSNVDHIARFLGPPPLHHYHHNPGVSGLNPINRPNPIFPAVPHPAFHHHHHYLNLPSPNVMSSPYYHLPQASNLVFCNPPQHQLQRYSAPAAADHDHQRMSNKGSSKPTIGVPPASTLRGYSAAMMNNSKSVVDEHHHHYNCQGNYKGMTTLNLFPVHPTGILEHKLGGSSTNNSAANSCATSCSSDTNMNYNDGDHQHPHFFDFFSCGSG